MKIYHQSVFERWQIENKSVQSLITSPPYFSLRKYSIPDVIIGGKRHELQVKYLDTTISTVNVNCQHEWGDSKNKTIAIQDKREAEHHSERDKLMDGIKVSTGCFCIHCNAWQGQHGLEPTFKLYLEHCKFWMQEAIRVLRDDGVIFVNLGDSFASSGGATRHKGYNDPKYSNGRNGEFDEPTSYPQGNVKPKSKLLIPERFAIMCVDELGLILRNHIVWFKPNAMPESCQDRFSKKWESIFMLTKSTKTLCWKHDKSKQWLWEKPEPDWIWKNNLTEEITKDLSSPRARQYRKKLWSRRNLWQGHDYYFDLDAIKEPFANGTIERIQKMFYEGKGKTDDYKKEGIYQRSAAAMNRETGNKIISGELTGKNPGDCWSIPTQPSPEKHFAMFPEKLVERMILCSTKAGDTVLDPFCGSGTTLYVADKLNRIGIGIELGYQDIQERRLREIQKSLL